MKKSKEIKEIITEAVISFMNESKVTPEQAEKQTERLFENVNGNYFKLKKNSKK